MSLKSHYTGSYRRLKKEQSWESTGGWFSACCKKELSNNTNIESTKTYHLLHGSVHQLHSVDYLTKSSKQPFVTQWREETGMMKLNKLLPIISEPHTYTV